MSERFWIAHPDDESKCQYGYTRGAGCELGFPGCACWDDFELASHEEGYEDADDLEIANFWRDYEEYSFEEYNEYNTDDFPENLFEDDE